MVDFEAVDEFGIPIINIDYRLPDTIEAMKIMGSKWFWSLTSKGIFFQNIMATILRNCRCTFVLDFSERSRKSAEKILLLY